MALDTNALDIGPLFASEEFIRREPEAVWDNNDSDPANEERWLAFFGSQREAMTAAEEEFVAEYKRRRGTAG